jgi:tetratricopeptide (TPR) repeat protein
VSVVTGPAGVGKTAFAVRWAHRVGGEFPDGHLYANLRGFDPLGTPVAPGEALRGFLEALETAPARIPAGVDERAALFRTVLAGRRVLVLLDNARDVEQVRPLLPGTPGCVTLVTSRDRLAGLVAAEGAQSTVLDLFGPDEAREFLACRLGADRIAARPEAVAEIVAACAGLPLALTIVAARTATNPDFTLGDLAAELRDVRARLDVLTLGDPGSDLRDVLSWSYRRLSPPAARLLRLLGSHVAAEATPAAAASLAGVSVAAVRPLLAELARLHLLTEPAPGRFGFHDLIRAYAVDLATGTDSPDDHAAARRRIVDHYARSARAVTDHLAVRGEVMALPEPEPGVTPDRVADDSAALEWFAAEEPALVAATQQAFDAGLDRHAYAIAWGLADFCNRRGHCEVTIATQRLAAAAAERLGDVAAQACAARYMAIAYSRQARVEQALVEARRAATFYEQCGDHAGQAKIDLLVADRLEDLKRPGDALRHARRALDLFRLAEDRVGQARALNSIGWAHALMGQYRRTLAYCRRALALLRQDSDPYVEAHTWDSVGYAHHHLGEHDEAITCYRRAFDLFVAVGDRSYEATISSHLGDAYLAAGDPAAARDAWQRAWTVLVDLGLPQADQVHAKLRDAVAPSPMG